MRARAAANPRLSTWHFGWQEHRVVAPIVGAARGGLLLAMAAP